MENNGFLSEEIEKYKGIQRKKNQRIFQLCDDVNRYSHAIMWQIEVTNDYLPEILSACAYVRAMSSYQSVIILSQYGLINEAKIILRSLVEGMFLMVAITKNKNFSKKIIEQDLFERERTCKAIKRNIIAGIHKLEKPTLAEIEKEIEDIKAEIDNNTTTIHKLIND